MKVEIVEAGHKIETPLEWLLMYPELIEKWGRKCYKSEHLIKPGSAKPFIKRIIKSKHLSVIEHLTITVTIICSRSCSHQLVRHRIGSYSQESQRYVNYKKKGYQIICPKEITEINAEKLWKIPGAPFSNIMDFYENIFEKPWMETVEKTLYQYEDLISQGIKPEIARSVLPNCMKTEIVSTFNLSQWRHIFEERALNKRAQFEIRQLMQGILKHFNLFLPEFFVDQVKKLEEIEK